MKFLGLILSLVLCTQTSSALEVKYLSHVQIPFKQKFENSRIGGLSGIYFEKADNTLTAVCDDRGNVNEPRLYKFSVKVEGEKLSIEPTKLIYLRTGDPDLSHSKKTFSTDLFAKVLDMEAISILPWGDFLITNEGDNDRKPRALPQIFSVNADGVIQKQYEIPDKFMPELQGQQTKGIRNNMAFEGLSASPDGKHWLVGTEGSLVQDDRNYVRWIEYTSPAAWQLKPGRELKYPIGRDTLQANELFQFQKGLSEVAYLDSKRVLALERYLRVASQRVDFGIQVYLTELPEDATSTEPVLLKKQMILDLDTLRIQLGSISNFEGMTLGPVLPGNRKTLILVSDDNFAKDQKTQFVLFEIKETSHATTDNLETKTGR